MKSHVEYLGPHEEGILGAPGDGSENTVSGYILIDSGSGLTSIH